MLACCQPGLWRQGGDRSPQEGDDLPVHVERNHLYAKELHGACLRRLLRSQA